MLKASAIGDIASTIASYKAGYYHDYTVRLVSHTQGEQLKALFPPELTNGYDVLFCNAFCDVVLIKGKNVSELRTLSVLSFEYADLTGPWENIDQVIADESIIDSILYFDFVQCCFDSGKKLISPNDSLGLRAHPSMGGELRIENVIVLPTNTWISILDSLYHPQKAASLGSFSLLSKVFDCIFRHRQTFRE